jgi:hypothetical protein
VTIQYFRHELPEEDTIVFVLTDAVRHTPQTQVVRQLREYVAAHDRRLQAAGSPRAAEMEALGTQYAELVLAHLAAGTSPPPHKSYTLKS